MANEKKLGSFIEFSQISNSVKNICPRGAFSDDIRAQMLNQAVMGESAELFSVIAELQIHHESIRSDVIRMALSDYREKQSCLSVQIRSLGGKC